MGGGPSLYYPKFEDGAKVRVTKTGEVAKV